jgi:uncharacterized protein (DUF2126 family)
MGKLSWMDLLTGRMGAGCAFTAAHPEGQASDTVESAEQIDEWLRWYHALEPLEFTPDEEAQLEARRRQRKEHGLAKLKDRTEALFQ